MTNSKSTKRALFTSALAMLMCVAMLIGTTFAWFTDTASTAVNKIQSGTLDVELYYADNTTGGEGTTWTKITNETPEFNFVKAAAAPANEAVLWEPGCTYSLPALKIKNEGNLALKYKVLFSATDTDAKNLELAKVLDVTMNGQSAGTLYDVLTSTDADGYAHGTLEGNKETDAITLSVKMRETAGNEYQDLSIGGIAITVVATQLTSEYDSNDNQYDKNAQYPEVSYAVVGTSEALADAISNAKDADGEATNKVVAELTTAANYTLPSLSGKEVTVIGDTDTVVDMTSAGNNTTQPVANKAVSAQFEGVTVKFDKATNYTGFQHTGKLVYKDCTISGLQFLYADDVEFINCTFEQTANDQYHIWTYSAKNVTFTGCTFKSTDNSKAVLCYWDGGSGETLTRTFNNCTFTCSGTAEKSAIMINPTAFGTNTYVININNCTATGYGTDNITSRSIVGVKQTVKDNITINIDGTTIYTHAN